MRKVIETISADHAGAIQQACLEVWAPALLDRLPSVDGLIVNLVDVETNLRAAAPSHSYAATIEALFADEEGAATAARAWAGLAPTFQATRHLYLTGQRIQLDYVRSWPLGERSPGVKAIYLVRRPEGVSNDQATRGWRDHADTARKHHEGMWKYVQNGVIRPLTVGAPVIHGVAELHFPTLRDLEERMYDSAAGRAAVQREADQLVGQATSIYCSEYVLRA